MINTEIISKENFSKLLENEVVRKLKDAKKYNFISTELFGTEFSIAVECKGTHKKDLNGFDGLTSSMKIFKFGNMFKLSFELNEVLYGYRVSILDYDNYLIEMC